MRVTACSIFRNSERYVDRYLEQMRRLSNRVDLRLVLTYGDCTDNTPVALRFARPSGLPATVSRCDHGGPHYGSVDNPARWDQIAKVVSHTLDLVGDPGDVLLWVESDLLWDEDHMYAMLKKLEKVPAVAPMIIADGEDRFYDIWGYRQNGRHFDPYVPYWKGGKDENGLVKIDSCGSCWATTGDSWKTWTGHWPFPAGGDLWLDPTVVVRHP